MFLKKLQAVAASGSCRLEFVTELKDKSFNLEGGFHKAYNIPSGADLDECYLEGTLKWYVDFEPAGKDGGFSLSVSVPDGQKALMNLSYYEQETSDDTKSFTKELVLKDPEVKVESYGSQVENYKSGITMGLAVDEIYFDAGTEEVLIVFKAGS
jgi:hypothetical protein